MKYSTLQLIKRILVHTRRYWVYLLGVFFLNLLATPIALLKPYALKLVIDSGFGSYPLPAFIRYFFPANYQFGFHTVMIIATALAIVVALIDNINGFLSWVLGTLTGEKIVLNFRTLLFNHIQRLSLAYHDTKGTSDSMYRIQWDTTSARAFILSQLPSLISAFITLVSMVIVMFIINVDFALIALSIMPPLFILTKLSTQVLKKDWYIVKEAESSAISVVHEVLSSLRVVKSFGQEDNEGDRFISRANKAVKGQMKMARIGAGFSFAVNMLLAVATALFLYLGATYVYSGKMTLGELTLVIAYLGQVFWPLQSIIKNLNEVQSSVASIERVFSVLDEEKEVKENAHAVHLSRINGAFQFKDVSFSYEQDRPTLQNLSFEIKPGDRVGIMGTTGAGKSTLVSLLMRFYDPLSGKILVDGEDIRKYKLADYRSQFSMVLQEPVLFSTTVGENIRYGRPGATDKEITEAAIAANAHNFIMKHKDGYSAMVGERGMQLSGGERQRISLARAFIKNAPVLILDEPTSSLDIRTEALIMDAMERLMAGRTTFMITHRLDSLNSCNLILHLEHGKLVEVVRDHDSQYLANKKNSFLMQD
jgi:ATP-binding cassette subfamily B protein